MRKILAAVVVFAALAPAAQAACTINELAQKAQTFATKWQEVIQKDLQRAQRFAPRAQEASAKYQEAVAQRGQNYDDLCRLYDELLDELEKSGNP